MNNLLFLVCPARCVGEVLERVTTQLSDARVEHQVVLYGNTMKAADGFVILLCPPGFPRLFVQMLCQDEAVSDYLVCSAGDDEPTTSQEGQAL